MVGSEKKARQRVGVVGSGISGLSSAWALAREGHQVTLLESGDRLGGHSLTYPGDEKTRRPPVDLGFQVFNLTTYPYLTSFFQELGVEHEPSDMSFALSVDDGATEWASHGLSTIFAQRKNAASPSFLRMIHEVVRFGNEAPEVLADKLKFKDVTLGQYLDRNGYSDRFRKEYLLPTCAAVWSVPNQQMTAFPVVPLIAFMANHHLLDVLGARPRWRVCSGRSQAYVDTVREQLEVRGGSVRLSAGVAKVTKESDERVLVELVNGEELEFEQVVMACHSDASAAMLSGEQLAADKALVSKIRYQANRVVLHSDESQMPRLKSAWASWNVLDRSSNAGPGRESERDICVTYWLNHLQNLPADAPTLLCTLNPLGKIDPSKIIFETSLDHPVFDLEAMAAQTELNELQAAAGTAPGKNGRNVWFAGAWLGSGFHEDGIRSAVAIATALSCDGATPPDWARRVGAPSKPALQLIRGPSPAKSRVQSLGLSVFESLAKRGLKRGLFKMVLPDGNDLVFGRASADEAKRMGEPVVTLRVHDLTMLWLAVSKSDIGLGEAYRDGMFDTDNLTGLFEVLIINSQSLRDALNPLGISAKSPIMSLLASGAYSLGNAVSHVHHLLRDNTVAGSRKNIEEHYDLGNGMYKLFLDQSMTYSCGIHTAECGATEDQLKGRDFLPQYEAQLAKLDAIIRRADLKPADHVLEIGCGWGSFAMRAAKTIGCRVTGITISTEQLAEARKRVKAAGLEDKVNLIICDYRKMGIEQYNASKDAMVYDCFEPSSFDKIVSIEMLEAVGHPHLPEYFQTVERMLKPGGKAVIQVISIHDERYAEYVSTSDFIRRFIFPGGHLPSLGAIQWATEDTALALEEVVDIGPDYAKTLDLWQEEFRANKDQIMALGYPETWYRIFDMYFSYCSAGFSEKYILDYHLTFVNKGGLESSDSERQQERASSGTATLSRLEKALMPAFVAFLCWGAAMSLTVSPVARQTVTIVFLAALFSAGVSALMPRLDPLMSSIKERSDRRKQVVAVRLFISAAVCSVVIGLVAFHDVLYTTRLANSNSALQAQPKQVPVVGLESAHQILDEEVITFNVSDDIHFCAWTGEEDVEDDNGEAQRSCSSNGSTAQVEAGIKEKNSASAAASAPASRSKYFMRSPMHFVVAVLAWCACSRLALDFTFTNGLHAFALIALSILAHFPDTATATSALGLAIVHGVSELHACITCVRALLKLRGYTLAHQWYANLWRADLISLGIIRWVPVPVLLFPVILRAPITVLIPICAIALRETVVLFNTLLEYKEDKDNQVNTDELLPGARSKEELINAMTKEEEELSKTQAAVQKENDKSSSAIYCGTVSHQRSKLQGSSPAAHYFQYNVWMAMVDLQEVKDKTAFQNNALVSVDGSWNLFAWRRSDHFAGKVQNGTPRPLDDCIKELVFEQTGQHPAGKVMVLTNLRCFGFVFNPVSIYYCMNKDHSALDAVVLEVSNTPWLERRMYVLPFFGQDPKEGWVTSKWKKDFHVSPFMDAFYNYEWLLTCPGNADTPLRVKAISTRRPKAAREAEKNSKENPHQEWNHATGTSPTIRDKTIQTDSAETAFVASLALSPVQSSSMRLLRMPFMTLSIVLYIHIHAAIVMAKGVSYKNPPANALPLGMADLARHLVVFAVAILWELASLPFRLSARILSLFQSETLEVKGQPKSHRD